MYSKKVRSGYGYKVVTYDRALRDMPNAQCGVNIHADGTIDFISYTTRVITINKDGFAECTGTYSQTTRKQIGRFLREYAPMLNYYDMKAIAETGEKIHIITKEIK